MNTFFLIGRKYCKKSLYSLIWGEKELHMLVIENLHHKVQLWESL